MLYKIMVRFLDYSYLYYIHYYLNYWLINCLHHFFFMRLVWTCIAMGCLDFLHHLLDLCPGGRTENAYSCQVNIHLNTLLTIGVVTLCTSMCLISMFTMDPGIGCVQSRVKMLNKEENYLSFLFLFNWTFL